MGMKKFVVPKYFIYLGQGNIELLYQLDEAVQEVRNRIAKLHLKSEDWNIHHPCLNLFPGDVFSLEDGELLYQVSYGGEIKKISTPENSFPWSVELEFQFESWNMWQSNRLEGELRHKFLTTDKISISTENWGGCYEPPSVITFVRTKGHKISELIEVAQKASPYIHLGFVGLLSLSEYFLFPVRVARAS